MSKSSGDLPVKGVAHTLIPSTAVAIVILEAAVILARYLFDEEKQQREEERYELLLIAIESVG